jgi:hypothetical protein
MSRLITTMGSKFFTRLNELATWNRMRTTAELRQFVEVHHAALPVEIDIE